MIIDLHCDTLMKLLDVPAGGDLHKNVWNIDLQKLQKSNYLLQDDFCRFGRTSRCVCSLW